MTVAANRRILGCQMDITTVESAGAQALAVPEISRDEIRRRLHDSALVLVDVLPREMYAAEHIPGAINLPLAEVEERALEVLPDRNADIAVYCAKFT